MLKAYARYSLSELCHLLNQLEIGTPKEDKEVRANSMSYAHELVQRLAGREPSSTSFHNFWPPRLVQSLKAGRLVCLFGAGLSVPSGLPSWTSLLRGEFPLDPQFQNDEELDSDPLTRAELSSHRLGAESLQARLRHSMQGDYQPTCNHMLAAALRLPVYITTNYDTLFEQAWRLLYGTEIEVIANSADLARLVRASQASTSRLYKIHGSVDRQKEHLILTRSDYRRHYRHNSEFFESIERLLSASDTLFLGFSHRDAEVTRLVENAIWNWEKKSTGEQGPTDGQRLNLYSMQFDMKSHTPEIFAARGIVALEPNREELISRDTRSAALSRALIDLLAVAETDLSEQDSLDKYLLEYANVVATDLRSGLATLESWREQALRTLHDLNDAAVWLDQGLAELGPLAGQGVYLLDVEGDVRACSIPKGLSNVKRRQAKLGNRPYFRQAKTYRVSFVSDAFESVFNGHATFALCCPIVDGNDEFAGLLFSACQIGVWKRPLQAAMPIWRDGLQVLLVDSNGVCLLPVEQEICAEPASTEISASEVGAEQLNLGFPFTKLLAMSRRDRLVSRIMENVVPLAQDDDVLTLSGDLKLYTVVTELRPARWKLAISRSIPLSRCAPVLRHSGSTTQPPAPCT